MIDQKSNNNEQRTNDSTTLLDLWGMFIPRWHWFVITLLAAFFIAFFYLKKTPPVYTRTASVLIKDNTKNGTSSGGGDMNAFSDLGIFKSNININNELLTFKSPSLMVEVVKRLNLDKIYTIEKGIRTVELYKKTPVVVTFNTQGNDNCGQFDIVLKPHNVFALKNFSTNTTAFSGEITGRFAVPITTPVGIVTLTPTSYFNPIYFNTDIHFIKSKKNAMTNSYISHLSAELANKDATIISLTIKDVSTQKAEDLLRTLIAVYNENWVKDKNQIAVSTSQFIAGRLQVIKRELGGVDENISSYKSRNLVPDVEAASNMYMTQVSETKSKLLDLSNQIAIAQNIRMALRKKKSLNQLLPTNTGIGNSNIEGQITEYNNLLLEHNSLLANSSNNNPLVKDMDHSLTSMQQAIARSVDNLIMSLNAQIGNIQHSEVQTTQKIASNPKQAQYLSSIGREQKVKEELYLYLLQKREENELSQAFSAYNSRVITPPQGSPSPSFPKKSYVYLIAFILGLLIPGTTIYLKETMNTSIRGKKDFDDFDIPFLGDIPQTGKKKREKKNQIQDHPIVVAPKNRNLVNEAFRVVRTNLEFILGKENSSNKLLMFTSFNVGSGKTFLTMNLATCFALKGKKILLLDLDLRKASMSNSLAGGKEGVSDYLGGRIDDIMPLRKTLSENLDLIPVGTIAPNPTELLSSERLDHLFGELKQKYDCIFIDCPPVNIVADSDIIAKHVDATLFVVRAGLFDRRMLPELEDLYRSGKFKRMSVLLNGVEHFHGKYGYYKYGYYKGYSKSYGNSYYTKEE